jgi:lysophospholipase L1-like esterase
MGGYLTSNMISNEYLKAVYKYNPKNIIYYAGGNDIKKYIDSNIIYQYMVLFYEKMNNNFINFIFISIIKSPKKRLFPEQIIEIDYVNTLIKKFCSKNNIKYINVNKELKNKKYYEEDNNHLTEEGYNKINKKILGLIKI